jgi:hypothetical protein
MINKLTIEEAWKHNTNRSYYVIQNPKIDTDKKKVLGLTIKIVEYKVRDWDKTHVNFERVNKDKDKRYPEVLCFDKRYPDAENEVYSERVSKAKKKPDIIDSYAIFSEQKMARFNKLLRLHRVAEQMVGIYKALSGQQEKPEIKETDDEKTKEAKSGIDALKVKFGIDDVKKFFNIIQDTGYFEELENIQAEYPDLAVK